MFPSTSPILIDSPSPGPRATRHIGTSKILHVDCISSCDKRKSYPLCLQLPLTVWAGRATINILPDDVLLQILHFDRLEDVSPSWRYSWHRLVHVCRRWRSVVFASPNFLDLGLLCDTRTRVELEGICPPLPIIIWGRPIGRTPN
jgi:hypothetical protein